MKKNLCKTLALCLVMLLAFSVVASAATISRDTTAADTVTISVAGVGGSDEVTLLVVPHGAELASITAENIIYIDQDTADAAGNATFTFAKPDGKFDAYSGFTTMDVTQGALANPEKDGGDEPGTDTPTIDTEKSKMYDKAFNLAGFKRIFVKLTEENGQWMPSHSGDGSTIYYSTEREGYDGLIKSDAADITAALAELTWNKTEPTEEQIIAKYGDLTGDGKVNGADTIVIKNYVLKKVSLNNKELLTADTTNDSSVNGRDTVEIKQFVLKKLTEFSVVNDR